MAVQISKAPIAFKGSVDEESKAQKAADGVKDTCKQVENTSKVVSDSFQGTSKNVAAIGVTATGLWATLRKPVDALLEWMKEPELDEAGKIVTKTLENGKEVVKKSMKYSKNKIIAVSVAAGVAVVGIATSLIAKHVKNKKAQQAEAQAQQESVKDTGKNLDVTSKTEDESGDEEE